MPKSFGSFALDSNSRPIESPTGISTQDATGSPQVSPLAITTGVTTIAVPTNAVEMVVTSSVVLRVSELLAMTRYFTIAANQTQVIPLARTDLLYVRGDSSAGTLSFNFNLI
jgi:hypothetical protein